MDKVREPQALAEIARLVRLDILTMLNTAGSGHTGGSLSAADILTALFFGEMDLSPADACWPERDRFVLSKGHGAPALYAALHRRGFLESEVLTTLRRLDSCLQGHPDGKVCTGVECSTGSLGQGLGVAGGMALGLRLSGLKSRVYCLLGDGELQEGMVWEAVMSSAHYRLSNLCAIVDKNGLQIDGPTSAVMNVEPLADKWRAFGWNVIECDGHDMTALADSFGRARVYDAGPSVVIAQTVKGKGVSAFEGKVEYHGKAPSDEELALALAELGEASHG